MIRYALNIIDLTELCHVSFALKNEVYQRTETSKRLIGIVRVNLGIRSVQFADQCSARDVLIFPKTRIGCAQ